MDPVLKTSPSELVLRVKLRYYSDSVTDIFRDWQFRLGFKRTFCHGIHGTDRQEPVEFGVSKWLKLTLSDFFPSLLDQEKQLCNGKTYKK